VGLTGLIVRWLELHHGNRFGKELLSPAIFIVADFGRTSPNVSSLRKDVVAPYTHVVPTYKDDNEEDPFEERTTLLYFQGRIKRKDVGSNFPLSFVAIRVC
jgi:hypothetical protein